MVSAVPITILATGKVERFSIGANSAPTKPPAKTTNELTDKKSACEIVNNQTFLGKPNIQVEFYLC